MTKEELFGDIDLTTMNDENFKEDSVREIIINPILKHLGYTEEHIVRSKTLNHPYLKVGSNKQLPIKLIPDYAIKIGGHFAWVLEAKSPKQKIVDTDNVSQTYSYAIHPEMRCHFFALCNGREFSLYSPARGNTSILYFKMEDIEKNWAMLVDLLSLHTIQAGKEIHSDRIVKVYQQEFDYKNRPLLREIPVQKQAAKRHFGVHGYFTKQAWNVVQKYIKNYTQPGDLVLDPFGGSGVTAIEAMMTNRKAIHIDLNPMSVFLVDSLVAPVNQNDLSEAFEQVKKEYLKLEPQTDIEVEKALKKYKLPKDLPLPKSSDVDSVHKLFSKKQLAQLALLKTIIKKQKNENIRKSLMLMFSGVVSRINLTYHISSSVKAKTGFGGDSAPMRYYRYRIAPKPTNINVMQCFELRYKKVLAGKKEMAYNINNVTINSIDVRKGTATNLFFIEDESVDYIYTDPPYGKNIPYLDLSTMWNAWLDLEVKKRDYELEAIEGGELEKTKTEYKTLLIESIQEMYRVLKFDRWMSFVFTHKNPAFWQTIVYAAQDCGFEYVGTVGQPNGQTSFKKRQNPFSILSGQLIMNFRKVLDPKIQKRARIGMNAYEILMQNIEGIIARNQGATTEQINKEIVTKAVGLGILHLIAKEYNDLSPLLRDNFDYNKETQLYHMRNTKSLADHVPLFDRIKYYLVSYLNEKEIEGIYPNLENIAFNIIPSLTNGKTPDEQTILTVLQAIAVRVGKDGWKLNNGELF